MSNMVSIWYFDLFSLNRSCFLFVSLVNLSKEIFFCLGYFVRSEYGSNKNFIVIQEANQGFVLKY